jgi:hypothetical protein
LCPILDIVIMSLWILLPEYNYSRQARTKDLEIRAVIPRGFALLAGQNTTLNRRFYIMRTCRHLTSKYFYLELEVLRMGTVADMITPGGSMTIFLAPFP